VEYLLVRRVVAGIMIEVIGLGRGVVVLSNFDSIGSDMVVVAMEAKESTLMDQQRLGQFVAWVGNLFDLCIAFDYREGNSFD
jgi:hypothetical protein